MFVQKAKKRQIVINDCEKYFQPKNKENLLQTKIVFIPGLRLRLVGGHRFGGGGGLTNRILNLPVSSSKSVPTDSYAKHRALAVLILLLNHAESFAFCFLQFMLKCSVKSVVERNNEASNTLF